MITPRQWMQTLRGLPQQLLQHLSPRQRQYAMLGAILLSIFIELAALAAFPLVPIAVAFSDSLGRLPGWARWLETQDRPGWDGPPSEGYPATRWGLIRWLWRNRAYRLRTTFPKVTFIVGVNGPMVVTGLRKGEVVVLSEHGNALYHGDDPRLLTCTEIVRRYFEIDDIHPNESGRMLREYHYLAANPYRSDSEHAAMLKMRTKLARDKILGRDHRPVPRETIGE